MSNGIPAKDAEWVLAPRGALVNVSPQNHWDWLAGVVAGNQWRDGSVAVPLRLVQLERVRVSMGLGHDHAPSAGDISFPAYTYPCVMMTSQLKHSLSTSLAFSRSAKAIPLEAYSPEL